MPRHASTMRHELRRKLIITAIGCSIAPAFILLMHLAIFVGSYELLMFALLMSIGGVFATALWILITSGLWLDWVLNALWTWRDSTIGPWSGGAIKVSVFLLLLIGQLAVALILYVAVQLIPINYSSLP